LWGSPTPIPPGSASSFSRSRSNGPRLHVPSSCPAILRSGYASASGIAVARGPDPQELTPTRPLVHHGCAVAPRLADAPIGGAALTIATPATEGCKEPGVLVPAIDRNRCEAKAACVPVCPYQVLSVHRVAASDWAGMSLKGRLKTLAHGGKQAYVVDPAACHACGRCVTACPERAITLHRAPPVP
jgi:NAD-dependent dihydropyrimidine dehydrogenase PreA subunit